MTDNTIVNNGTSTSVAGTFQSGGDNNLSHDAHESTRDFHFCRPLMHSELDAITCPTAGPATDNGVLTGVGAAGRRR